MLLSYQRVDESADSYKLSFAAFGVQFINGPLSDRFGRRSVLWSMTVVLVSGLFVEMFARNWWQWLISKILMGMGQGMCQHGALTVSYFLAREESTTPANSAHSTWESLPPPKFEAALSRRTLGVGALDSSWLGARCTPSTR